VVIKTYVHVGDHALKVEATGLRVVVAVEDGLNARIAGNHKSEWIMQQL